MHIAVLDHYGKQLDHRRQSTLKSQPDYAFKVCIPHSLTPMLKNLVWQIPKKSETGLIIVVNYTSQLQEIQP